MKVLVMIQKLAQPSALLHLEGGVLLAIFKDTHLGRV